MLTQSQLSRYRKTIGKLLRRVDRLSSRCLFIDSLIQGTPAEVFRTCGRSTCKCAKRKEDRHGPYKIIQVFRQGRSRQICLRREEEKKWERARHYQIQMQKVLELKATCLELERVVKEVIKHRVEDFP